MESPVEVPRASGGVQTQGELGDSIQKKLKRRESGKGKRRVGLSQKGFAFLGVFGTRKRHQKGTKKALFYQFIVQFLVLYPTSKKYIVFQFLVHQFPSFQYQFPSFQYSSFLPQLTLAYLSARKKKAQLRYPLFRDPQFLYPRRRRAFLLDSGFSTFGR